MELEQIIINRRSIRRFKDQSINLEDITSMVQAARMAPSWKNTQVTRYYAVINTEIKEKIVQSMPEFNQPACQSAPLLMIACAKKCRSGYNRRSSAWRSSEARIRRRSARRKPACCRQSR